MERIDANGKWKIENGVEMLVEPSEEWKRLNQPEPIPMTEEEIAKELLLSYCNRVKELVRLKYPDADTEIAILRKYTAGIGYKNEFAIYNEYVEGCKVQAKIELGLLNP